MKKGYNLLVLKALGFFIENPYGEIHLREFARKLNISVNSAQRFLNLFLMENFVIEEKRVNLRYFKANLNSVVFRNIKIVFSLKKIEGAGIMELLKNDVLHFVLFGSVAKGLDGGESDVDFLIIGKDKEKIRKICSKCSSKFDKEVNFHVFSLNEWKKQKKENKAFYQDIISIGINLIGETPL